MDSRGKMPNFRAVNKHISSLVEEMDLVWLTFFPIHYN